MTFVSNAESIRVVCYRVMSAEAVHCMSCGDRQVPRGHAIWQTHANPFQHAKLLSEMQSEYTVGRHASRMDPSAAYQWHRMLLHKRAMRQRDQSCNLVSCSRAHTVRSMYFKVKTLNRIRSVCPV